MASAFSMSVSGRTVMAITAAIKPGSDALTAPFTAPAFEICWFSAEIDGMFASCRAHFPLVPLFPGDRLETAEPRFSGVFLLVFRWVRR